ncbi:MAG: carboxymuconolactone decarboxylase family protein [Gemmataceae bacterium]
MANVTLNQLEALRDTVQEPAKDMKINLSNVLGSEILTKDQVWGVALASVFYIGDAKLKEAVLADAKADGVSEATLEDAQGAAALMGMNTVYYRFRHMIGKDSYSQKPAKLRMQKMLKPSTNKADFELFSMAVAALAGCEMCITMHEKSILEHGLTEDHVHESVRIAAVLQGFFVAISL